MNGSFATVLNCMDGRIQASAMLYLSERFGVDFIDTITEAGIVRFLSDEIDSPQCASTLASLRISMEAHGSRQIAVGAHDDCTGNPRPAEEQLRQLRDATEFLRDQFPQCEVIGLWIDEELKVHEAVGV